MKLSRHWRASHRRYSVRALIVGVAIWLVQLVWSAMPAAVLDRFPLWLVVSISGAVSLLGYVGTFIHQPELHLGTDEGDRDA